MMTQVMGLGRNLLALILLFAAECGDARPLLEKIVLPPGFHVGLFASVPHARSLALGDDGTVFVGTRSDHRVYALSDRNHDGVAEKLTVVADHLNAPNGVAVYRGDLYVAETDRLLRYDNIESQLRSGRRRQPVVIRDDLPKLRHHGWRYIAFGPDGRLYITIGAPCNVCDKPGFASIKRMNPDGSDLETFAEGVRNSVGMDWNPETGVLWFTDNGRDMLGDDLPPDELNRAPRKGMHFGFPYCHGGTIPDPVFGTRRRCDEFAPPAVKLGPHVASLGMRFYSGKQFPPAYRNQIILAEHGSWNRSTPIGYRLSLVTIKNGKAQNYATFAEGWLQNGEAWGRPVDVLVMPDGALLVSDDLQGVIYRIRFDG